MGTPTVIADLSITTGGLWTAVISGIRDAHSVVIEAWGANGALSRIFPRGRDEMKVQLRFIMPGETTVSLTVRDNDLRPAQILELPVQVMLPGWLRGAADPQRGFARALSTRIPPMGANKPPLVPLEGQPAATEPGAAPADDPGTRWDFSDDKRFVAGGESVAVVGAPWVFVVSGIAEAHSVVVECYGANGGLNRIFPRGRNVMSLDYAFSEPGATHVCVSIRDTSLKTIETLEFDIDVVEAGRKTPSPAKASAQRIAGRISPMGTAKPPMAALNGHTDGRTRSGSGPGARTFGGMSGPSQAVVGETITVSFTTPSSAAEAKFSGSNAEVGWFSARPISGGSTASTSARVYAEGTATIYGTAYDQNGTAVHECTHTVQVRAATSERAPAAGRPQVQPPGAATMSVADAMAKSIEDRIRNRTNRRDT